MNESDLKSSFNFSWSDADDEERKSWNKRKITILPSQTMQSADYLLMEPAEVSRCQFNKNDIYL